VAAAALGIGKTTLYRKLELYAAEQAAGRRKPEAGE